jgi:hypothetical protein
MLNLVKPTIEVGKEFIVVSTIINNQLVKQRYIGYSASECYQMFRKYIASGEYKNN